MLEDWIELPVDHSEKPSHLLAALGERLAIKSAFDAVPVTSGDIADLALVDERELRAHLSYLDKAGLIECPALRTRATTVLDTMVRLTIDGWAELRKRGKAQSNNKVFIALQFEWPEHAEYPARVIEAIKAACRTHGFEADIVSQSHTDEINDRIVREIREAHFVVADFTFNNRGVYFEAGLARGLGKHVFHLVMAGHERGDKQAGKHMHFDVEHKMYRKWLEPEEIRQMLEDWIGAVIVQRNNVSEAHE